MDDCKTEYVLWRLPKATDIPPLPSLAVSRQAHSWTHIQNNTESNNSRLPHVLFHSPAMGGMAVDPFSFGQRILVTTKDPQTGAVMVVSLPVIDDQDDDDPDHENSRLILDYTQHATAPGAMEVDNHGTLYLAVDGGVLIAAPKTHSKTASSSSSTWQIMAKIVIQTNERIVDLTVGSDRFLYIAMERKLARVRVQGSPWTLDKQDRSRFLAL